MACGLIIYFKLGQRRQAVLLDPAAVAVHDDGACCGNDARASALRWDVTELILLVRRLRGSSRRSKAKAELR